MSKFLHGLAIGLGIIVGLGTAILAGACVLYLALYTRHFDVVIDFIDKL